MIVYANELYLQPREGDLKALKQAIKDWLVRKIGPAFRTAKINPSIVPFCSSRDDTGPNEVTIIGTPDDVESYSLSINYKHNDRGTRGRAWFTRIGIERRDNHDPLHVTILLETSEISPLAAAVPVTSSQPGIVRAILKSCPLGPATPGATVRKLTPDSVAAFINAVDDPQRFHAVIVVSPDDFTEKPLVDVEELRSRLVGLAQIYLIPNKRDARRLSNGLLPSYHTAWDGSITVISPGRGRECYGRVYRNEAIETATADTGLPFDRILLQKLTHQFNLYKSRRHVGDNVVLRRMAAYKLAALRAELGHVEGLQDIVESYEEDRNKAQNRAEEFEAKLLESDIRIEKQEEEIAELTNKVRTLQYHLERASASGVSSPASHPGTAALPESLTKLPQWIETLRPGQLLFTGRAVRTLKNSPYGDLEKAAAVFQILAGKFCEAFRKSIPFQTAIDALKDVPARYAGNQSEVTAGMKEGYVGECNGKRYALRKHIRIGSSRDPRFCFCVYFEWEPEGNTIIVLHAGEHLDTQST